MKILVATTFLALMMAGAASAQTGTASNSSATAAPGAVHDGAHDFDFLIGNWKAHLRVLPERLSGSNTWFEYDGISNHKKLLDSNANFEEFDVSSEAPKKRRKGQTLRLYDPETRQWSIYLLDLDHGTMDRNPVVGQFTGDRGEFYCADNYKGHAVFVRYVWRNLSPEAARMEQSFSADGGKTWEVNWICELSR